MEFEHLLLEVKDGVLIVTINRESALNAINHGVMSSLGDVFRNLLPERPEIKGVIITGAGAKAFVAGADIKGFINHTPEEGMAMSKFGHDVFAAIENCPIPVIAAVNGFALGGGCELAMACHMRIASEKAKFGQPEVNLGLTPGYGATQRLVQLVGKGKALELLLTADLITATEAMQMGLVNQITPPGEELQKSMEVMQKIIQKGPLAVQKVIACVNDYFDKDTNGYQTEIEAFGYLMGTADFTEGTTAFVEKRTPHFKGK